MWGGPAFAGCAQSIHGATIGNDYGPKQIFVNPSDLPGKVIWESDPKSIPLKCNPGWGKEVMFWPMWQTAKLQGFKVGIRYNGQIYYNYTSLGTGYKGPLVGAVSFILNYSIVITRTSDDLPANGVLELPRSFTFFQVGDMASTPFGNYVGVFWGAGGGTEIEVITPTCSIAAGDVSKSVRLPPVLVNQFPVAGTSAGKTQFSISLTKCSSITKIAAFSFSGKANPNNPAAYNNFGAADGIGVYLRTSSDDRIIRADGQDSLRVIGIAGPNGELGLTAEYVSTQGRVGPGSVSALATFTVNYQ